MPSGRHERKTYSLADIARELGHRPAWIYRNERWRQLIADDDMPEPIVGTGRPRFHKPTMDAWLGRHHPNAPRMRAANDTAPVAQPASDGEWQEHFARVYGRQSA